MKKFIKIFVLALVSTTLVGCGKTIPVLKDGTQAVATIGKKSISAEELYNSLKTLYGRDQLINLIDTKILGEMNKEDKDEVEFVESKFDEIEEQAAQYNMTPSLLLEYYGMTVDQFNEQSALTYKRDKAVNEYVAKSIEDKEIEKYYEENIFGQINCKHILIAPEVLDGMTEEEKSDAEAKALKTAKAIIKKLKNGEDWDKLAKKYSADSSNASKGGDLGWFTTGEMVKEFEDAAFALKKGKYTTEPVKTTYGYHIIYKIDEEAKPSLKDAKEEVIAEIVEKRLEEDTTLYNKALQEIRKEAGLDIIDSDMKSKYDQYMSKLTTPTNN